MRLCESQLVGLPEHFDELGETCASLVLGQSIGEEQVGDAT